MDTLNHCRKPVFNYRHYCIKIKYGIKNEIKNEIKEFFKVKNI